MNSEEHGQAMIDQKISSKPLDKGTKRKVIDIDLDSNDDIDHKHKNVSYFPIYCLHEEDVFN